MELRVVSADVFDWKRDGAMSRSLMATVEEIVSTVRTEGDAAVRSYSEKFDHAKFPVGESSFEVPAAAMEQAWANLDEASKEALAEAAERIRRFHRAQLPRDVVLDEVGEELGMVWRPLGRVGVYAPGGRAAYPSTVLMNVIPAQVAGVGDIVLVSPPTGKDGLPHQSVLAAAHLLGVQTVLAVGGAQAVAALAYGTETISRVDKIVGPGNAYVACAKRMVMGDVGIDSIAGPSEVFIVADEYADPVFVAADMLAQAEHDEDAGAVCVTTNQGLVDLLREELSRQLSDLPRQSIARTALSRWGMVVLVWSLDEAMEVVNKSAPEHVELLVRQPELWLSRIRTAGAVFLGDSTPEPVGDYFAGPNHTLPTHGTARYASGLSALDFLRRMTYVRYDQNTLIRQAPKIIQLAELEGLGAHANSVRVRLSN